MALTLREQAEAIERFGDDLAKLDSAFGVGLDNDVVDRVNAVAGQDQLGTMAKAFQALGLLMQEECDDAEALAEMRREAELDPDFRRA